MVSAGNGDQGRMFSFTIGDVIQFRVNLTHEENLERITVVFGRDGGEDNTITFAGEFEGTVQVENYPSGERSLPLKESTVMLRMAVDVDHRPGEYHFLNAYYRSEYTIGVLEPEDLAATPPFRVVQDGASMPRFNLELIDNSEDRDY